MTQRTPLSARVRALSRRTKIVSVTAAATVIIAVAVAAASAGSSQAVAPRPVPAKNFVLPELGHPGRKVSLAAYAGRPVIVNFFASWCTPCQHETPLIARFYADHHGKVLILGVDSNDQAKSALRFVHTTGVRYPVGSDPFPASTTTSYGVYALPQTFILNSQHRIIRHIVGAVTMKDLNAAAAMQGQPRLAQAAAGPGSNQDRG
jgi:cytochrome c biogenesis protein CcmG/thiol:disulfide interchange protein DsbE